MHDHAIELAIPVYEKVKGVLKLKHGVMLGLPIGKKHMVGSAADLFMHMTTLKQGAFEGCALLVFQDGGILHGKNLHGEDVPWNYPKEVRTKRGLEKPHMQRFNNFSSVITNNSEETSLVPIFDHHVEFPREIRADMNGENIIKRLLRMQEACIQKLIRNVIILVSQNNDLIGISKPLRRWGNCSDLISNVSVVSCFKNRIPST